MSQKEKYRFVSSFRLTGIHSAGRSFGRLGTRTVYVDFAIPGELVDIKTAKRQKGFSVGMLESVSEPSENRTTPICKHFGCCGGCSWQHISYPYQLELKRNILVNALSKYEVETPDLALTIASPNVQYYRNKLEYAFSSIFEGEDKKLVQRSALGFHPFNRFDSVISIDECFLQPEPSRRVAEASKCLAVEMGLPFYNQRENSGAIRSLTIRTSSSDELMVVVGFTPEQKERREAYMIELQKRLPEISSLFYCQLEGFKDSYVSVGLVHISGTEFICEKIGNITFSLSPKAFFQPNVKQATSIYQTILTKVDFRSSDLVYDLYTGVGSIACFIASAVRKVIGIEGTPEAIADARYNAELNGVRNAEFVVGDILETFKPNFIERYGKPDIVILDPPRSGTLIEIKRTIVESQPRTIVYLSCNPVSLAFDLKMLTQGYRVNYIQPFDMFPHTHHVETLVVLNRLDKLT